MIEFTESNFYKALQDFFINNNKQSFLEFLAEFYNRTENIINKNDTQDDLIKELRELYIKFNEEGIDENIVKEKVNFFLENSNKIENINKLLSIIENKKLDKTSIITMGNIGQDIREAMTGGSVAVVGKNSVGNENVKFSSLNIYNTDFMRSGNNLLNRKKLVSGYVSSDGTILAGENYKTTNIIPVNGNRFITLQRKTSTNILLGGARDIRCVLFLDSNLQPISNTFYDNSTYKSESVPIPSSASYLRVSFQTGYDDDNSMLHFGNDSEFNYYDEYTEIVDKQNFSDKTKLIIENIIKKYILENNFITLDNLNFVEKIGNNLWNNENYTQGYLNNNGTIAESAGYLTSDYIIIKGEKITAFTYNDGSDSQSYIRKLAYYDENLNPLTNLFYDNGDKRNESITLNNKATYIKITIAKELNNNIMIVYGDKPPSEYQPYKYKLKNIENVTNENISNNLLKNKVIFNFGDSIGAGDGNNGKGYAELLGEKYEMNVTDYAVGGATLGNSTNNNIVDQVDNAIATGGSPDYILIDGGTNDIVENVSLGSVSNYYGVHNFDKATTSGALEYIFSKLKTVFPDAKIIFVSVHKMSTRDYVAQTTTQKRCIEICNKWSVPVADIGNSGNLNTFLDSMHKYTNGTTTQPNGDKTHPNQLGYEKFYLPIIYNVLTTI